VTGRRALTVDEMVRMLDSAACQRDRALFALCCWAGVRLCEALALDVADVVTLEPGTWSVAGTVNLARNSVKGKTSGRRLPIHERPSAEIRRMLQARLDAAGEGAAITSILREPLFLASNHGKVGRLSNRQGRRTFVKVAASLGLENVGSHSGRKTFAQGPHNAGVDLQTITEALGHRDPKHTRRYFDVDDADLVRAVGLLPSG